MQSYCKYVFPLLLVSFTLPASTLAQDPNNAKSQSKTLRIAQLKGSLADTNDDEIKELYDSQGNPVQFWYASWARTFADCGHTAEDDSGNQGDAWLANLNLSKLNYKRDIQDNPAHVVHTAQVQAGKTITGASAKSTAGHGTIATANTSFTSTVKANQTISNAYDFTVTATTKVYSWAKAVADAAVPKDTAIAEARAKTVHGYRSAFKTITAKADVKISVKLSNGDERTEKRPRQDRGRSSKDPVLLTIWNNDTGEQISELLGFVEGACDSTDQAWSSYSFDSIEGALLEADLLNASASLFGAFDSSWLDNPYGAFGATLANGIFEATGVWASLPWALTYAIAGDPTSGIISAFLAAEYLPTSLGFTVPQDYVDQGYDDEYELNFFAEFVAFDRDSHVIPTPASLPMAGLGLLILLQRKTRA